MPSASSELIERVRFSSSFVHQEILGRLLPVTILGRLLPVTKALEFHPAIVAIAPLKIKLRC